MATARDSNQHGRASSKCLRDADALRRANDNSERERSAKRVANGLGAAVRNSKANGAANEHSTAGLPEDRAPSDGMSFDASAAEEVSRRVVNAHAELAFHVFACIPCAAGAPPLASAASLYDPTYEAWSEARGAPVATIREDAAVLRSLLADPHAASTISLLALVHESIEDFLRGAVRPLLELTTLEVTDVSALTLLCASSASPAIEIVRADMALDARSFEKFYAAHTVPRVKAVAEHVARMTHPPHAPAWLRSGSWELSLALGIHGRVFGSRVVVGAGRVSEPLGPAAARAHALICHEHAVARASAVLGARGLATDWAWVEALSIAVERDLIRRGALPLTHADWLGTLSLDGLAEIAAALEAELTLEAIEGTVGTEPTS